MDKGTILLIAFNSAPYQLITLSFKGELQPKISLLHMKVITLIKAKRYVFLWTSSLGGKIGTLELMYMKFLILTVVYIIILW